MERRRSGTDSVIVALGLGCCKLRGLFLEQGSSLCPLCWQEASYPVCHHEVQGASFKDRLVCWPLVGWVVTVSHRLSSCQSTRGHLLSVGLCFPCGASQVTLVTKNPPAHAGDVRDAGSISGLGRFPGGGHGNPLQCSCLENPKDRGAWGLYSIGSQRDGHS